MGKHESGFSYDDSQHKRPKVSSILPKASLNPSDCNLDFTIEGDGITGSGLHEGGFAYCWSGARANTGIKGGKYCFGCIVLENQEVTMENTSIDQTNICRVGFSRGDTDIGSLGECSYSFGYGGTGKFSNNGVFTNYGERFGVGDTIICAIDLENQSNATILFAKNGLLLGIAKVFDASSFEKGIFPHILLKNVKVKVLLSIDDGLVTLEGYKPWDHARDDGNEVMGPSPNKGCEVIMMIGLPGSGKTTWAEKWTKENPEKRYMLLGTNLALDQMKMPGLSRKGNYGERFEKLMYLATEIFNKLLERAAKTPRNYILDQTNVYKGARSRKLKDFKEFYKIAVVVFPDPDELKRRTLVRTKEMGKEIPDDALNDMIANFVLPNAKYMPNSNEPFDEVRFVELQRHDAQRHLLDMKNSIPSKEMKKLESTHTSGSSQYRSSNTPDYQHQNIHRDVYLCQRGMDYQQPSLRKGTFLVQSSNSGMDYQFPSNINLSRTEMDYQQSSMRSYQREEFSPNVQEHQYNYMQGSYSRDMSLLKFEGNPQDYTSYSKPRYTPLFPGNQPDFITNISREPIYQGNPHDYTSPSLFPRDSPIQSYNINDVHTFAHSYGRDERFLLTNYPRNYPSFKERPAGANGVKFLERSLEGDLEGQYGYLGGNMASLYGQSNRN